MPGMLYSEDWTGIPKMGLNKVIMALLIPRVKDNMGVTVTHQAPYQLGSVMLLSHAEPWHQNLRMIESEMLLHSVLHGYHSKEKAEKRGP